MVSFQLLKRMLLVILITSLFSCSQDKNDDKEMKKQKSSSIKKSVIIDENFHGWDSVTLRNPYVKFDVVPELGGKIMGYELHGYQSLWHDSSMEGKVVTDQGYGFGQKFFNPGGSKVWPAPQGWSGKDEWPGPPDNVLDASNYEYTFDGTTITVISPEDNGKDRTGLQYKHNYKLIPSSTIADLDLSMTNVINQPVRWGLWHLVTLPVDRPFTVYAPVKKGDWHVIYGDDKNPQWLGVEDGLFRARYEKKVGKVGLKVREGWAAWHDEENNIVFAVMFPVEKNQPYPDSGSNVEIWMSGAGSIRANNQDFSYEYTPETAILELEVMGPLTRLAPGQSSSMNVKWGMCRCTGFKRVFSGGVVAKELEIKDDVVTARFGVFYRGFLQTVFFDKNKEQSGYKNVIGINPVTEVIIKQEIDKIPSSVHYIRYQVTDRNRELIGVMGEIKIR